jgi:hypothetical protein
MPFIPVNANMQSGQHLTKIPQAQAILWHVDREDETLKRGQSVFFFYKNDSTKFYKAQCEWFQGGARPMPAWTGPPPSTPSIDS